MSGTVLVTGADGFIGKCLVVALESLAYRVQAHSIADGDLAHCALPYRDIAHVFHLAGKAFVPDSWTDPRSFYETNVLATVNVLDFCRRSRASLTFISSYVYGTPGVIPVPEDQPLQAFNPYCHSKILAEEVCRFYTVQHGLQIAIVRPFNIYGPGQDGRFLIPTLVRQALAPDSSVIEVADVRPRRDFLYISDLIDLLVATMLQGGSGAYNAGSGVSTSIQEIVAILNRIAPRPKPLVSRGESRPQEVLDLAADIRKAERELHWKPRVDIAAGLQLTMESALHHAGIVARRSTELP
jgi:Nucleoside-diphosphate-sugar epimerases